MVVVMKSTATQEDIEGVKKEMETYGLNMMVSHGDDYTILGAEGNAAAVDQEKISLLSGVERVMRVSEPYKMANRKYHPQNTEIDVGGVKIGGKKLGVIAGPCSVESEEQIAGIARAVKASGACALRGGAYKPRTSPYAFQGLKQNGIKLLEHARAAPGMPIVTEIMSPALVEEFDRRVTSSRSARATCKTSTCCASWARRASPCCSSAACPPRSRSGS